MPVNLTNETDGDLLKRRHEALKVVNAKSNSRPERAHAYEEIWSINAELARRRDRRAASADPELGGG